jgi:hypothetical protein
MGDHTVADFGAWLRRLRSRFGQATTERSVVAREHAGRDNWALLDSVGSAPLGAMYADLLRQAGIPVRLEQWAPGSGALGGSPVGLRILVPEELLSAAQDVLHVDEAGEGVSSHEG